MGTIDKIPEYLYTQEEMDYILQEKKNLESKILFWATKIEDNHKYLEFFNIKRNDANY